MGKALAVLVSAGFDERLIFERWTVRRFWKSFADVLWLHNLRDRQIVGAQYLSMAALIFGKEAAGQWKTFVQGPKNAEAG